MPFLRQLLKTTDFDPLAYIEQAFLDRHPRPNPESDDKQTSKIGSKTAVLERPAEPKAKFKKTVMSAPRPRRVRDTKTPSIFLEPDLQDVWETLPRNIEFLCSFYDDSVTSNYYRGEFKESRQQLIRRLLDPELSLEETSRLLGVCPATVRRYTNRKWLTHHRTTGGQRRFRLSDLVKFVEQHGRFPEE